MRETNRPPARDLKLESLEDRTLFDAVPFVDPNLLTPSPEPAVSQLSSYEPSASRTEVVFIDAGVEDPDAFLTAFASDQNNVQFQFLDASTDGLEQIADYLAGRRNVDAVHIISHGNQAKLILGDAVVQGDQLHLYTNELRAIGAALSPDADILIYGCNLGRDDAGLGFVRTFADLTGADVAASDNVTGHQDFGGDWDLEVERGFIESAHGVSEHFATDHRAVLGDLYVTKDDLNVEVVPGDSLIYTLNYGNAGTSDAFGVVITETLPPGTSFDVANSSFGWSETAPGSGTFEYHLGTVPINVSGSVRFAVSVEAPATAGIDQIMNSASIADDGTNGPDENLVDNTTEDIDVLAAVPNLYVTQDDGGVVNVSVGDTLIYTITYGNDGDQGAANVVVSQTLAAGTSSDPINSSFGWFEAVPGSGVFTYELGTVAAQTSGSLQFAVTIDPQVAGVTQLTNNVSITDDGANGAETDTVNNSSADTNNVAAAPDLVVNMEDGDILARPGESIVYIVDFANIGSQGTTGVVLTDTLPANTTYDAVNSTPGWVETSDGSGTFEFNVGSLRASLAESVTFAIRVNATVPPDVTQIENSVTISDDGMNGADTDPGNNATSDMTPLETTPEPEEGLPEYTVSINTNAASISASESVTYTIDVTNVGDGAGSDVAITKTFDPGVFTGVSTDHAGLVDVASGLVEWTVPAIDVNETVTLTVFADAAEGFIAGIDVVHSDVIVSDDDAILAATTNAQVGIDAAPELVVAQSVGSGFAADGESVTFTIEYTNEGTQDATGVVVTEHLRPGTLFDPGNSSAGWVDRGDSEHIDFVVGHLAAGESLAISYAVTINDVGLIGAVLENLVEIADDGANGSEANVANNSDVQLVSTRALDKELISVRHLLATTSTGAYVGLAPIDSGEDPSGSMDEPSNPTDPSVSVNEGTERDFEPLDRLSRWGRFLRGQSSED